MPNDQAKLPAHAGRDVMARTGVIRVAGLLQRFVQPGLNSYILGGSKGTPMILLSISA